MQRILIVLLLGACQASAPPAPPLAVAPESEPAAPRTPTSEPGPEPAEFEFFREDVEIDAGDYIKRGGQELGDGLVLLGGHKPPYALLHLDTLEIDELQPFVGSPTGRPTFKSAIEHGFVVASFEDKDAGTVEFQVLRLATKRWEKAGRFNMPESRIAHQDERKFNPVWVQMQDGVLKLRLTDELEVKTTHVIDFETLVWTQVPNEKLNTGPCLMSATADDDRIQWGLGVRPDSKTEGGPCVAVRATTSDDWRRIEDPADELIFMRTAHRIDERRFLMTGGFAFKFFPFVSRADVVDVVDGEIRSLGQQVVGKKLQVPGEPFLWLSKESVVRFDADTETFSRNPGPNLDFTVVWWFSIDERTQLFAGQDKEKQPHYVVAGFRPVK